MLRHFVILLLFCWCVLAKEIPSFIHVCKRNNPDVGKCFQNTLYEIMPYLIKGIPEIDVPPIDPLGFNAINIDTGSGGSVNLDIHLENGTASGLQNLKMDNIVMDFDKFLFFAELALPRLEINAIYKVRGKLLLFELNGGGLCSINATDIQTKGIWKGNTYKKKNKTHLNIDTVTLKDVKIENIRVRLNNLFPDNEAITENVNNAINDNINSLKEEVLPLIIDTLEEIIRDYFNRVYRQFPMDQLYPTD